MHLSPRRAPRASQHAIYLVPMRRLSAVRSQRRVRYDRLALFVTILVMSIWASCAWLRTMYGASELHLAEKATQALRAGSVDAFVALFVPDARAMMKDDLRFGALQQRLVSLGAIRGIESMKATADGGRDILVRCASGMLREHVIMQHGALFSFVVDSDVPAQPTVHGR